MSIKQRVIYAAGGGLVTLIIVFAISILPMSGDKKDSIEALVETSIETPVVKSTGKDSDVLAILNEYRAERIEDDKRIEAKEEVIRKHFRIIDKLTGEINGINSEIDVKSNKAITRLKEAGFTHDMAMTVIMLMGERRYEKAEKLLHEERELGAIKHHQYHGIYRTNPLQLELL